MIRPVTLTSNIQGVLDRARRRPRDIQVAIERTLNPEAWRELMLREAQRTLWALAKQEEWRLVDVFLNTVLTAKLAAGFFSRMSNPVPPVMAVEDFAIVNDMQLKQVTDGSTGPGLFSKLLNQFDEMMTGWVANEKRKDARDFGKSDEEIGRWIGTLLMTPDKKLSPLEQAAKQKLMPHLVEYLQRKQASKRLADDTVNAWLLAVLAAWRALVQREFPGRLEASLAAIRAELN